MNYQQTIKLDGKIWRISLQSSNYRKLYFWEVFLNRFENIVSELKSNNPEIRHNAALNFLDLIEAGKKGLIESIQNPNNINYTGTLIYVLQSLDCSSNFALILELILNAQYESYIGAITIYKKTIFRLSDEQILSTIDKILDCKNKISDRNFEENEKQERLKVWKQIYIELKQLLPKNQK